MSQKQTITPLMQQYFDIKTQYQDSLILFQVGDFYELFFDDAQKAAAYLGIALTSRGTHEGNPIPLCGVPVHALDHYLAKLIKGGFNVAICNQLEDAQAGKLVRRGVTQVLTPATLTDTRLLDEKSPSYLLSFVPLKDCYALIFGELLTAQLYATVIKSDADKIVESEVMRFFPDEIVVPPTKEGQKFQTKFSQLGYCSTVVHAYKEKEDDIASIDAWINKKIDNQPLSNTEQHEALTTALYYFYAYMRKNQPTALSQFNTMTLYQPDDFLQLDAATQRNLELVRNNHDGSRKNTLFSVMDNAATPMGSRLIKKWIQRPLFNKNAILQRQEVIQAFIDDITVQVQLRDVLSQLGDVERVVGRIGVARAQLHDYSVLKKTLHLVPYIHSILQPFRQMQLLQIIDDHLGEFHQLHQLLVASLNDDTSQEWIIKKGFDLPLDNLRDLITDSSQALMRMELEEQEKTGIQSLKIRYNNVYGYYIEVTKSNTQFVPDYYVRQQTLVGRERYITAALQQLQSDIMGAQDQIKRLEKEIFEKIKQEIFSKISDLRKLSYGLAHLDALISFSYNALTFGYVCPQITSQRDIIIKDGRHPVVEQVHSAGFIPNDTVLTDKQSLWIITGPNMGGKSTYLRQVALIAIMAQCGSFIPALEAHIPLLDRVFTRIGAGDNVAEGKSTFLVEMEETAIICSQATDKSLVILDEVGRGTSTFDGLAIAQAVVEYLYAVVKARCLFATHYHELTQLQDQYPGIVSYHAASTKTNNGIIFLYKMIYGKADGSFGVEVAKLAELPAHVIMRSQELLDTFVDIGVQQPSASPLVSGSFDHALLQEYERVMEANKQLKKSLDDAQKEALQWRKKVAPLQSLDFNTLSPKQAYDALWLLKDE